MQPAADAPIARRRTAPPELLKGLGDRFQERCGTGQSVRHQHGRDESPYDTTPPDCVVFPSRRSSSSSMAHRRASRSRLRPSRRSLVGTAGTSSRGRSIPKIVRASGCPAHGLPGVPPTAAGRRAFVTDACVPISRLAECIAATIEDTRTSSLPCPILGHVGGGNFHCIIIADPSDAAEMAEAERLNQRVMRRALAMDGTCTGEHGVGMHKILLLGEEFGDAAVDLMRRLKTAWDPLNILNPGKVVTTT